jgi:hypothetical protein
MKFKILSLLFFACMTLSVFADDIIVTVDGERIDAVITEVSDSEVKFKRKSNPDGPLVVMSTAKIATVIYSNGTVQAFGHKSTDPSKPTESLIVTKIDGNTYRYGSKILNKYEYEQLLKNNCQAAYKLHREGKLMMIIGPTAGAGLMAIGAITLGVTLSKDDNSVAGPVIGGLLLGTGAYGGIVGVTSAGAVRKKKALQMYNTQCVSTTAKNQDLRWSLTTGANGLGIALNF